MNPPFAEKCISLIQSMIPDLDKKTMCAIVLLVRAIAFREHEEILRSYSPFETPKPNLSAHYCALADMLTLALKLTPRDINTFAMEFISGDLEQRR